LTTPPRIGGARLAAPFSLTLSLTTAFAGARAPVGFEQLVDETGGLQFIELLDPDPVTLTRQVIELGFVELVLVYDLEDQVALALGALPRLVVAATGATVGTGSRDRTGHGSRCLSRRADVHEARIDDLRVHGGLQPGSEIGAGLGELSEVG
jgi:hypothetical protein